MGNPVNRVLVNATTLKKGGALQAAANFIRVAGTGGREDFDWSFALSPEVLEQVKGQGLELSRARVFRDSPARSVRSRVALKDFEAEVSPKLVFTFFGPAYMRFRAFHLCGVADPGVTHPNRYAYLVLGRSKALTARARQYYRRLWVKRAHAWVVEAEVAREGLVRLAGCPPSQIDVVPNVCSDAYRLAGENRTCEPKSDGLRVFVFSAYYPHKNLELIPEVAAVLRARRPGLDFRFVMTLPGSAVEFKRILHKAEQLGVLGYLENMGVVPVKDGPAAYARCDVSFLPTLHETSTAVFPESMAMGLPIVTTRMGFNTEICRDAAMYFEPMNATSAADMILKLVDYPDKWEQCVKKGREIIRSMSDQGGKYRAYRRCIEKHLLTQQ